MAKKDKQIIKHDAEPVIEQSVPQVEKIGSLAERRALRQASAERVRESAFESVMSDEEFAESVKVQIKKI